MGDREAVKVQLGRDPAPFFVVHRCPFGLPAVVENEVSREMPTSQWVTCPVLTTGISRVESAGGVRAAQQDLGKKTIEETHSEHLARYGSRVAGVRGEGHVKCLHAFTALHLSGTLPNTVAEWTLERIDDPYRNLSRCCTLDEEAKI